MVAAEALRTLDDVVTMPDSKYQRTPGGVRLALWKLGRHLAWSDSAAGLLRKEVIQPQVLLQLPCYDFTPITDHTVGTCLPFGLAQRLLVQPAFVM